MWWRSYDEYLAAKAEWGEEREVACARCGFEGEDLGFARCPRCGGPLISLKEDGDGEDDVGGDGD